MIHTTKVGEDGILNLPDEIVESLGLKVGDELTIKSRDGIIELTPKKMTEVEIDLPDDVLLKIMTMAHEQDITLNQFVNNVLRAELEKAQKEERIPLSRLLDDDEFDRVIKMVEDGKTFIICEDDECLKPLAVLVPMNRYEEMKSFL